MGERVSHFSRSMAWGEVQEMRRDILKEAYDREGKKRKREERLRNTKKLRYGKGKLSMSAEVEMNWTRG